MPSNQIFSLLFGLILGLSLSTIVFYPNKISKIFASKQQLKVNKRVKDNVHITSRYNDTQADRLFNEVRILCWIITTPENHLTKALHIQKTWGNRCNKLLFMSSQEDMILKTIALPVREGRSTLWDKTRSSLQYIYNHHFNDAEWFLKADDDAYIVAENLRYLLYQYRPHTSVFVGHRFASNFTEDGYNAGGSYILSKKALEKFVTKLMRNSEFCRSGDTGAEDLELGRCLQNSTLYVDTRDELNQKRFFPVGVEEHLRPPESSYWYDQMIYYPGKYGSLDCCSDMPVQFHYIPPEEMYLFEYLIYNVHPYGVRKNLTEKLPRKLTFDEIVRRSDVPSSALEFIKHTPFHAFEPGEKY